MANEIKAPINKIIPFSSVDGRGNRTSIFLQGCNINCKYCHNPETRNLCINCGDCVLACKFGALSLRDNEVVYNHELCAGCDECIKICEHGASPKVRYLNACETFEEIKKQIPYIRGITVSGGECTLYPKFLLELSKFCKDNGLSVLLDSNGFYDFSANEELVEAIDGVMLDIKAHSESDYKKITDFGRDLVMKNVKFLADRGKLSEVRTVISEDLFEPVDTVKGICEELIPHLQIRYKLIKFRPNGVRSEYKGLKVPNNELMNELYETVKSYGFKDIVII